MDLVHEHAEEVASRRQAGYEILPLFLNRWSPRSMTGEPLRDDELWALFEAARWAPSSFNAQPWRFVVARRQDPEPFEKLLGLVVPGNQAWARDAGALVVVLARTRFEFNDKSSATHAFDAGAAWENLALEGARRGLVIHGMEGFSYERARKELQVPDDYAVLAMIAVGQRGPRDKLPERARAAEQPNARRPLREILFDGTFGKPFEELT